MCHHTFQATASLQHVARVSSLLAFLLLVGWGHEARAQWSTQTNALKPGWNAIFLQVDASYTTLDQSIGNDPANPIQEVWYWQPTLPTGQFVDSPQVPTDAGSQWITWTRSTSASSRLQHLTGNGAYLVKVAKTVTSYNWLVKGKPVSPTFRWTLTGLNFIGFPTPSGSAPPFDAFLAPAPQALQSAEIYSYPGGDLGPKNPILVTALRNTSVRRDQAYWVRAGESYNQYFGPVQLLDVSPSGIRFRDTLGQTQFRIRNLATVPVAITLRSIASEDAPVGQTQIVGKPALLLRGAINTTNLTFGYSSLESAERTWNLAAAGEVGSEVEVILGLDRSKMSGVPGALFGGILRFTDSLGLSQLDVAVSAEKESTAGLWVGSAAVNYVSQYLKPYAKATNSEDFAFLLNRLQLGEGSNGYHYERDTNTGRVLVFGGPDHKTGSYLLDGPIKIDSGKVARPFQMRLIVHNDGTTSKLLQKVYHGVGVSSNLVLATKEEFLLPSQLSEARRISSVQFPTSAGNLPWNFTGTMQQGGSITVSVPLAYDDHSSNPFLHTYHPDHDNLDAQFATELPQGVESYGVTRQLTLSFQAPADDFNSLTRGSQDLNGNYAEVITLQGRGTQTRQYNVLGTFTLKRISDIASLTSN